MNKLNMQLFTVSVDRKYYSLPYMVHVHLNPMSDNTKLADGGMSDEKYLKFLPVCAVSLSNPLLDRNAFERYTHVHVRKTLKNISFTAIISGSWLWHDYTKK